MSAEPAYVALAFARNIGPARLDVLMRAFGSASGAMCASLAELSAIPGMTKTAAHAVRQASAEDGVAILRRAEVLGARVSLPTESDFPDVLRHIPDPPPILFVIGDATLLQTPAVALVGSRDHTAYGLRAMRRLAIGCARAGVTVVSGLARGLDAVAHDAALDAGGNTVGVLGNGIGVVYPASNRALYQRMREHGCIVSEFAPDARPTPGSFPRRNRIISALARMVVVVEARTGSGALITADAALNQGREVGAVPGPVDAPASAGPNRLIQLGARPVLEPRDVLDEFGITLPAPGSVKEPALGDEERVLVKLLRAQASTVDDLAERLRRSPPEVLVTLTELEIRGLIRQDADGWIAHPN